MIIAIPTVDGKLCIHFGHCDYFTFIEINEESKTIINIEEKKAPEHSPGILPPWVVKNGATTILAGGIGIKAQELFAEQGVKVISGIASDSPEKVALDYINDKLVVGANACDH